MGNCLYVKPATKDEVTTLNTREAPPAHYMIKIESFSVLEKYGIKKYETKEFVAGDYKWRLIFKFNGKDSDYISVNLAMADTTSLPTNWEVNALFSVFLFNQISGNYLSSTATSYWFSTSINSWGWPAWIELATINDPNKGFIVNDCCLLSIDIHVQDVANIIN
ncbi:PREDICTED: MATH domain and coiled-coil domain-containing protein At3g58260-like [Erythranthe guttata]|uniref:MATH domain and coiled-coil domain-containing protein At3g58260-like n=1 Tax=Erythranthe guttata TaxID=4155 RepID=UPI00064D7C24|nr:PREDICTED: MATH domain and coiled-coil domain-containing protein At3g58260-like [Erythranthe guttata]|eukprot:XP_012851637.1 PREDICTED: MATH domain and coiled-coil domain-containing protein At3g58260-like [Erythranthe guttata]